MTALTEIYPVSAACLPYEIAKLFLPAPFRVQNKILVMHFQLFPDFVRSLRSTEFSRDSVPQPLRILFVHAIPFIRFFEASLEYYQMAPDDTQRKAINAAEDGLLTIEQLRDLLQVGRTFAYSIVKSGELPSYRVRRLLRVRRVDVEDWLEQNRCAPRK